MSALLKTWAFPIACLAAMFIAVDMLRPLMPVDETRYMTVAWEMFVRHNFTLLTLNFEPYHHKPPMLFWLINAAWGVFGISRAAALVPIAIGALLCMVFTAQLARLLFPGNRKIADVMPAMFLASVPFVIYGTLVMFDIWVTVFVLATLVCCLQYARFYKPVWIILAGASLGLGLLTKGPVIFLHVLPVLLAAPLWAPSPFNARKWYGGLAMAVLISVMVLATWLYPALKQANPDFIKWLLWKQTAGRVTGNFSEAHVRPFYFYLPILPALALPWLFLPSFWNGLTSRIKLLDRPHLFFLLAWIISPVIGFSLIAGKQVHYLLPLVPPILLLVASLMPEQGLRLARPMLAGMMTLFIAVNLIGANTVFNRYDLGPVASFLTAHPDAHFAFNGKYHGELTYLARYDSQVATVDMVSMADWFAKNPNGYVLYRYEPGQERKLPRGARLIASQPFRNRQLGVFMMDKPAAVAAKEEKRKRL